MSRTVLVVDDNTINRQILKKILSVDYNVLEAENGLEAINTLKQEYRVIAAVLLDIVMPVMNGFEVLDAMRSNPMLAQIPVIVTTGSTRPEAEKVTLSMGANDFVTKPFDAEILRRRLDNLIKLRETAAMVNTLQKDRLTGAWNRETFFQKAEWEIKRKPDGFYTIVSLDIENFKVINDQFGNEKGDEVLKSIAETLLDNSGALLCGRVFADRFVALYPTASLPASAAEQRVFELSLTEEAPMPIIVSMGRYVVNDRELSVSSMYDRACIAQSTIKGRYDVHFAVYDEKMRSSVLAQQRIVNDMNAALEQKQFEPWFQPQYNHFTGALIGAEALVRWRHPSRGLVSPGEFIPVFERNGFVYEVDKFVWKSVCEYLHKWLSEGRSPLPVSVNISRTDLFHSDLVDVILGLVEAYDVPVELLRLEITESAFASSTELVVSVVKQFIAHGFTVEIDDFGSGYSSLNTLKDVPAQILKLDMRFLEDRGDSESSDKGGNILESIVRMAKWIGMSVIAEGVETVEQADYLKSIGCNYIQGYLYARPMPAAEYEALAKGVRKEEKLLALETVENLDNNTFWDPNSMDTLIFNSYVGGACIFEYHQRDGSFEIIRVTDKYVKMLGCEGLSPQDIIGVDWMKHIDPECLPTVRELIEHSRLTKEEVTGDFIFNNLPGCKGCVYLRSNLRVIATAGESLLVYCASENITAQREAELARKQLSERLSAIMASLDGGLVAVALEDNKLRVLFSNERFYTNLGYTREQFHAEVDDVFSLILESDRVETMAQVRHAFDNETAALVVTRAMRRDGSVIWLQSSITTIRIPDVDKPVQLTVMTDITAQHEAERQQRVVTEQLRVIMANVTGGIAATVMDNGQAKNIFANDTYYSMLGYTKEQFEAEVSEPLQLIHPDDKQSVLDTIHLLAREHGSVTQEYRCKKRCGDYIWIRCSNSVVSIDEVSDFVLLGVSSDITKEMQAESEIRQSYEQLRLLNDMAADLLAQPDITVGIDGALSKILTYFGGRRSYIFEFDDGARTMSNTYEVCAEGVSAERENLQNVALEDAHYWLEAFERGEYVNITDVSAIPDERAAERRTLCAQGINAVIIVPLRRDGDCVGFIGVDDPTRNQERMDNLQALGDYVTVILTRRDLTAKIENDREALLDLMNDTPGGFARFQVMADGSLATVFINEPFCRMRELTRNEIMYNEGEDALSSVHPDDIEKVKGAIGRVIRTGETLSMRYRIKRGDGKDEAKSVKDNYTLQFVFMRVSKDELGYMFINAYYADMNEREKKEVLVHETMLMTLSAIMRSSTDLTFAKDRSLTYISCSPAFAKFAGQKDESGVIGKTDFQLFSRGVAEGFRRDDLKLIENGEPLIDFVEPIPSRDAMQHYASTSKYVLRNADGELLGIYGNGRDITDTRAAYERLNLLTDSIYGGIATYDMTRDSMKLVYFNDGFCSIFGYSPADFGKDEKSELLNMTVKDDERALRECLENMCYGYSQTVNCNFRIIKRGGTIRWVNLRAKVSQREGGHCIVNTILYDVTNQRDAEEEAKVHAEEMKVAMAQMNKMVCEYDPHTHTMYMPEPYAKQLGLTARMLNYPEAAFAHPFVDESTMDVFMDMYRSMQHGHKEGSAEYIVCLTDGTRSWKKAQFSSIVDSTGYVIKVLVFIEDTTKQHRVLEVERNRIAYGETDLLGHALIDVTTGETLEYSYANGLDVPTKRRTAFTYGKDTVDEIVYDEYARARYRELNDRDEILARYERGETVTSYDFRRKMSDGSLIWIRNIMRLVSDPESGDLLMFDYFYKIEEQKLNELLLESIVCDGYDYVARINGKDKSYTIISGNSLSCDPLPPKGRDFDALTISLANAYVHPDDLEMSVCNTLVDGIKHNLESRERFQFTCREQLADGSIRFKKLTEYYIDREMEIIIVTREDITQIMQEGEKKNHALSEALSAAKQASLAKSTFLSRMSHELRTPMNAIIGLSALSETELSDEKAMENNIDKIGTSAHYLLALINDILEMSRIESGRMTLSTSPFDFEKLISEVNTIIYGQAVEKGLKYNVTVTGRTEPIYVGDATKLQEILVNILGNAVKFTPKSGSVTLGIEQVRCSGKAAMLRFTVTDTGIGIDESFLPHIFDAFSQESSSYTSSLMGTGLGLAISKSIAEMMNGSITVVSERGKGSTFTVEVQLGISDDSEQYAKLLSTMELGGTHALIVDDDETACRSTEKLLSAMGFETEYVCSGEAAVERVKQKSSDGSSFDTIFIDWKMDGMDGIETTRQMRKLVGPDVTIIIMTAFEWSEIEKDARAAGVDVLLDKPLFRSSIIRAFEKIQLSGRKGVLKSPKSAKAAKPAFPDFRGKHILLAEDNEINIEVIRRLLERTGARVSLALNGLQAVEVVEAAVEANKGFFDAILMDIRMPELDGLEATKRIRKLGGICAQVPIIAMTANAFEEDVQLSLKSGMNAHMTKPIEPQLMYDTLKLFFKIGNGGKVK